MLSDIDIRRAIQRAEMDISPLNLNDIQPSSVDIHLGNMIKYADPIRNTEMDPLKTNKIEMITESLDAKDGFLLRPGMLLLVSTKEVITCGPQISACVFGISSLGRLGLSADGGSPFIDAGFSGTLTLELAATSDIPVRIRAGMRIAQVVFYRLENAAAIPYGSQRGSKYQGQREPTASRYDIAKAQ